MSVVTGALESLAPKLLQLLHEEYKLQTSVKKQVQWLSSELKSVRTFLGKVEDVPWYRLDEQVKVWARQVREASYDMEDVLDTFLVRVDCGEPADPSKLKSAMNKIGKVFSKAKARRDIAVAIENIRKHLEEVAKRHQKYKLDEILSNATTSTIDPRLTAMYKEVKHLIGVDKSRDELISRMMPSQPDDDASDQKVTKKVSIVGVGGLGKTTLAKVVYDKLKSQYQCGAFVSVGRDLDFVKVFKDILFDLDKDKYKDIHNTGRDVNLLIREVREFLDNKRYFVVVDDVWDIETWTIINSVLVENNRGSKVITTTRKCDVAKEAGEVYKLQPLSYHDSKKLFYTRIFGVDGKNLDNQPDDVSDKILKKCDGIPLAIITMTSLLVDKPKDQWPEVYNSIGFGHKDNRDVDRTMRILSFSYYDMPSHLRTCLLYLSTYPEDYVIPKNSLIRKWIAEGFVHGEQGTTLFELGETYFNDLINRSMIQAVEHENYVSVPSCRVHDMVLDLMRKLSSEENFIVLLEDNNEGTSSPTIVRRLAHQKRKAEHIISGAKAIKMPKVRSYTAFRCHNWVVQFSSFKLLRVLAIEGFSSKEGCHLEHLGNLLHLRYLGLRGWEYDDTYQRGDLKVAVPELPKQIGDLKLLQTLDVSKSIALPGSIVQLTQLVRLCAGSNVPDGIGKLTSLEDLEIEPTTLTMRMPESFVKELSSLRELRVLKFWWHGTTESMQRDLVESLNNLQKIQQIDVVGSIWEADTAMWEAAGFVLARPLRHLRLHIDFSELPSCINPSSLPNLSYLSLYVTTMGEGDLKRIARLPALCTLYLLTESTVTASNINASDGCFQKLRYLHINSMVQFWRPDEEDSSVSLHLWNGRDAMPFGSTKNNCGKLVPPCVVMPNLEVLRFCVPILKNNNGDYGNFGLEYLPSLREVVVHYRGGSAAEADADLAALRNECEVHPNHPTLKI